MSPRHVAARSTLLSGLILTGLVMAQGTPTFESLDTNRDGKVSLNEASANDDLFVKFKELDKNRDGDLTREEFAAYQKG